MTCSIAISHAQSLSLLGGVEGLFQGMTDLVRKCWIRSPAWSLSHKPKKGRRHKPKWADANSSANAMTPMPSTVSPASSKAAEDGPDRFGSGTFRQMSSRDSFGVTRSMDSDGEACRSDSALSPLSRTSPTCDTTLFNIDSKDSKRSSTRRTYLRHC